MLSSLRLPDRTGLEAHCLYHPSTTDWAFAAGKALLAGDDPDAAAAAVPEAPP